MTAAATIEKAGVWALVPVKRLDHAKSRLSGVLDPAERRALAKAMLYDVLAALAGVGGLAGILVVTADPEAAATATSFGATVLAEPEEEGLNAAIAHGMAWLEERGKSGVLVVPADIPFVTRPEIRAVLAALRSSAVVAVPATRDGGTNILAVRPPAMLTPAFGQDSLARHLAAARTVGAEPRILSLNGAGHDIDVAADLQFGDCEGPASRTRARLGRFLRASLAMPAAQFEEVSLP